MTPAPFRAYHRFMHRARRPPGRSTRPRWLFAAAMVLCGSLTACAPPVAEPPATAATADPTSAPAAGPSEPPSATPAGESAAGAPRVSVDEVKGGSIDYARAIVAPTAGPMKQCRTGSPTAVRVRLVSDNGEAALHVEPGSAADGSVRRCVLEALSTIELPETTPKGNAPSANGFSSVVTVQW
jgi:hypothetical protein